jgi:CHAT domain-containing protein
VTLSACDTGVGVIRNGEGVSGLRRAFFLAGAETLVMSLWPVSDYVTRMVMTDYYGGLARGLGGEAALRRVQLAMLADPQRAIPFTGRHLSRPATGPPWRTPADLKGSSPFSLIPVQGRIWLVS